MLTVFPAFPCSQRKAMQENFSNKLFLVLIIVTDIWWFTGEYNQNLCYIFINMTTVHKFNSY